MAAMSPELVSALFLSVQVALSATLLNALLGIPIAYVLARRRFWATGSSISS
jgi:ABC-type sulfate transport system permease component